MASTKITISKDTGLTPTQEKACVLLASGASVTNVAENLNVSRATLYNWQRQTTFKCYVNRQCSEARSSLLLGLYGMAKEALQVIQESLNSSDERVKLKTAMWITDQLKEVSIGQTDIIEAVRAEATYSSSGWSNEIEFHEEEFKDKLKSLGVTLPSKEYIEEASSKATR